ncbi:MAG: rRNA pseudouridine synthase [Prevotella sp.]|nr:rRNA pseudouridine synthase [Prevotella sp.]
MSEELENKIQEPSQEQNRNSEGSREGYGRPSGYQSDYREEGARPQRQRIHTQRAYSTERSNSNQGEGGFRPEGFGAGLQSGGGEQGHSSYNGYQQRQGGYQSRQGGYQNRGGYQQRQGGYQQRQGGYNRPRYNNQEGGYQSREGGYQPREGGYQQREGGYQPRQQGGYQQREGGYQPREGGYQPRQQGGYGQRQGGYQPRQGGYQPRQQGGYGPRQQGGYGPRQQGGYGQRQQGGYRPRPQGGYGPRPGYDPNAKYSMKKRIEYKEEHIDPNEPIRLNKYLANAGVCSRREADEFIQAGVVTVNGNVVTELGSKVMRTDEVKFHDQPVSLEKKVYVLLNKPKDYVTTSDDPQQRKTVMDLVKDACPERIYPVGRLDRNTTGVLLLTNDGDMASKLTHPKFLKKKVYHVFLDKNVAAEDLQKIADGIELEDGEVHADAVEYADERDKAQVGIEIHSGKNRIVRRIFEALGYRVIRLDRVQFAGLTKKNLRRGDWRFLTEQEVDMLRSGMFE